ncbi:MAG: DUF1963 domain-containing protein [Acidobacteria bacterium]|nr:DUF1963 domain-containing protein [Acidobacteriota bacterium]
MSQCDPYADELKSVIQPVSVFELAQPKTRDADILLNRFGGRPFLEKGTPWPVCSTCQRALDFICQLDASGVFVTEREQTVWFSLFYCWSCFPWDTSEGDGWRLIIHQTPRVDTVEWLDNPHQQERLTKPVLGVMQPALCAPDWTGLEHYCPQYFATLQTRYQLEELEGMDWLNALTEATDEYVSLINKISGQNSFPLVAGSGQTMVGGYPQWLQADCDETPTCPDCTVRMSLLAQVASLREASLMWADGGTAYLFFCPAHRHQVCLRIQCH